MGKKLLDFHSIVVYYMNEDEEKKKVEIRQQEAIIRKW